MNLIAMLITSPNEQRLLCQLLQVNEQKLSNGVGRRATASREMSDTHNSDAHETNPKSEAKFKFKFKKGVSFT